MEFTKCLVKKFRLYDTTRKADIAATSVQKLLDMDSYQKIMESDPLAVRESLSRIHWDVLPIENGLALKCKIDIPTLVKDKNDVEKFIDETVGIRLRYDLTKMNDKRPNC